VVGFFYYKNIVSVLLNGTFCFLFLFASVRQALAQTAVHKNVSKDAKVFNELLKEYRRFPKEFNQKFGSSIDLKSLAKIDSSQMSLVSESVMQSRYTEFNVRYSTLLQAEKKLKEQLDLMQKRRDALPISDPRAADLELKMKAHRDRYHLTQEAVFLWSIKANESLLEALTTISPDKKLAQMVSAAKVERPKLPGVFQGAAEDRQKLRESDKTNLTPVDPEFYETQLGKKLESDLKGRVDFWSYDYGSDDLYVKVGGEVAKVSIFQDVGGTRFIRTRVGGTFNEARSGDERVDMLNSEGRFLTGDKQSETLFGKMPSKAPKTIDERKLPPGHFQGDGHDHDHDH